MIGTSMWEYIFIRGCAIGLHFIAPLSLLYCSIVLFLRAIGIHDYRYPLILEIWLLAETAFFLFVYLPFNYYLQRAATHPELPPREGRRELFRQCHDNVPDPQRYLSKWFLNASAEDIKRENVKEFLRWAFLNKSEIDAADEEELNEYVEGLEKLVGRRFEKGRGEAKCLRLTLDRVDMLHRSLAWYMVSVKIYSALQTAQDTGMKNQDADLDLLVCFRRGYVDLPAHAISLFSLSSSTLRSNPNRLSTPAAHRSQPKSHPS